MRRGRGCCWSLDPEEAAASLDDVCLGNLSGVLAASCQRSCKCPFGDCLFVHSSRCHAATPCSAWHALHPALSPYMDPSVRVMRLASGRSQPHACPRALNQAPARRPHLTQQSASRSSPCGLAFSAALHPAAPFRTKCFELPLAGP